MVIWDNRHDAGGVLQTKEYKQAEQRKDVLACACSAKCQKYDISASLHA